LFCAEFAPETARFVVFARNSVAASPVSLLIDAQEAAMADMEPDFDNGFDPQDSAEVYDETHLDDEGDGDALLDEMEDVFDATRPRPEGIPLPAAEEDFSEEDDISPLEAEADALLAEQPRATDEIELVYTGLMRNQRGAQASAAHWEAKRLSDDDVEQLGYDDNRKETDMTKTPPPTPREEQDVEGPATRKVAPHDGKTDQLRDKIKEAEDRQEALIDEAVEETMDASDPPSPKHIT